MWRLIRWLAFVAMFPQGAILYHHLARVASATQKGQIVQLPMLGEWSLNSLGLLLAVFVALELWRSVRRMLFFFAVATILILLVFVLYVLR